jgi:type I restriction enzyme S subunit
MGKWDMVRLGDVCTLLNGRAYKQEELLSEGKTPVLRVGNFFSNREWYYSNLDLDESKYCEEGDLLYAWSASFGPKIWDGPKAIYHYHIWKIRTSSRIDKKFLFYLLGKITREVIDNGRGIAMIHATKSGMENIQIPLPPLPIQQKIADVLDRASALIEKRKAQIEKLNLLVKSRFIEMFGDPVTNPMGWNMPCIEETVSEDKNSLKAGPFGSSLKKEHYVKFGYKIYGQEQVITGDAHYGDYYISEDKYLNLQSCAVRANDVLISLVGTYGKILIIPDNFEPGIINPRLMKITFDPKKMNTTYFRYFFASDSLTRKLSDNTHGGTMDILNLGIVRKIRIPLPPLSLQSRFADFVRAADKSKVGLLNGSDTLQRLYKSLTQKCFNGDLF